VFKAVDGHGLSRVDFFLDRKTNKIYLNEINTLPGFTNISMYPQLIEDFGVGYSDLIDKLIELAFNK
jgi:D-alanine-D-alanine ligase